MPIAEVTAQLLPIPLVGLAAQLLRTVRAIHDPPDDFAEHLTELRRRSPRPERE